MNDPLWAVTIIASILLFGILLFYALDRVERWSEKKQQMEMRREAQRQRETLEIVREVGKQMLGTLRPGEVNGPATEEERVESPVDGSTAWWTEPGDMTDPTDNELPDPGQFVDPTDLSDPGEQNLG